MFLYGTLFQLKFILFQVAKNSFSLIILVNSHYNLNKVNKVYLFCVHSAHYVCVHFT